MTVKVTCMHTLAKVFQMVVIFSACVLGANSRSIEIATTATPPGGAIVTIPSVSEGVQRPEPAVVEGVLAHGGVTDVAFVFKRGDHLTLRIVPSSKTGFAIDAPLPGIILQPWTNSPIGIAVKSLVPNLGPMIIVASSEGASAGTYLSVFAFDGRELMNVASSAIGGFAFRIECADVDRACRIIAYGKWVDASSMQIDVYEWSGKSFVQTDTNVDVYKRQKLTELTERVSGPSPMSANARLLSLKLIAQQLSDARQFDAAIDVASRVLNRLHDQSSKAAVHDLMGSLYRQMGDTQRAQSEFSVAEALRSKEK